MGRPCSSLDGVDNIALRLEVIPFNSFLLKDLMDANPNHIHAGRRGMWRGHWSLVGTSAASTSKAFELTTVVLEK
jgi:hypothetical protein